MRVSPINVTTTNNNRKQNPNFGMRIIANQEFKDVIIFLKDNKCTKKGITALFDALRKDIDNTITLRFTGLTKYYNRINGKPVGKAISGVVTREKQSETFHAFMKNPEYDMWNIEQSVSNAARKLKESDKFKENEYRDVISRIFKQK